jgi:hypothetical protein
MNTRMLTVTGLILAVSSVGVYADEFSMLPDATMLPKSAVKISEVVPAMGEHWADPKDLPLGQLYCVYNGKIICIEYMISQADLQAGKSWPELVGLKDLPPINHVNMGFEPNGHEGYEVPHYDMHIYFVSPDALKTIKPVEKAATAP